MALLIDFSIGERWCCYLPAGNVLHFWGISLVSRKISLLGVLDRKKKGSCESTGCGIACSSLAETTGLDSWGGHLGLLG